MTGERTLLLRLILFLAAAPAMGGKHAASAGSPQGQESIGSQTPSMTDIHDIQPPVAVGFDTPWLLVLGSALGIALLLAAAWWLWKKKREQKVVETIVPERPPEWVAKQGLDRIGDVGKWSAKAFYFHLSAVLRRYVSGRFAVGAPEMTTEEFLPCIEQLPIDSELAMRLKTLFRSMDPVKFGDAGVTVSKMEKDWFFAREFVRRTTQVRETEEKASVSKPDADPLHRGENAPANR